MKLARLLRRDPSAPTLRERAAALREGLSRKAALAAPVAASQTAEAHPDAALIALWQRWEEGRHVERAALDRWNEIPNARDLIDHPAALFVQPGDEALGIAALASEAYDGRPWYCVGNSGMGAPYAAAILREPRRRNRTRPPVPEDNLPADAWGVVSGEPWPEAQARADAIVAAWDWFETETARLNVSSGHDEAEAAWIVCDAALDAIEHEIAAIEARTVAGITIKARFAQSLDERGHRVSDDLLFEIVRGLVALDTPAA